MSARDAFAALLLVLAPFPAAGQTPQPDHPLLSLRLMQDYWVAPNITYSTASGYDCKLDVYVKRSAGGPIPTVLFIHGGGWVTGMKETSLFNLLPYIERGFSVVNVEYRLARTALAPAAVEDCRLALRWVYKNANTYNFDTSKIVVTGGSAGGHLALMTGMLDSTAGFDSPKEWDQSSPALRVAAIVNWFGIADVKDLLSGPNRQPYAVSWIGGQASPEAVAERVSPLSYVRANLPPVLTIHGDRDELVPYSHAVRLHKALDEKKVENQLVTVPGGRHGGFKPEEMASIYDAIWKFLEKQGIRPR